MPVHDWTRVDAGIFHHFHNEWMTAICNALNRGLLPQGYYALIEQHAGSYIADVLALQQNAGAWEAKDPGGVAVAKAPGRTRRRLSPLAAARQLRKTVAIRHVSGHQIVALLEAVSPANKDRRRSVADFAAKVEDAIRQGVHVLMIDLLPPGPHDPRGLHAAIWERFTEDFGSYSVPPDKPLTLASYLAEEVPKARLAHVTVGHLLPAMALFLNSATHVDVPLEDTYQTAYENVPMVWQKVIDAGV